jgi:hypothetical protein
LVGVEDDCDPATAAGIDSGDQQSADRRSFPHLAFAHH